MRSWLVVLGVTSSAAVVSLMGCGGAVIWDGSGDGGGGAGGSGTTSSSTTITGTTTTVTGTTITGTTTTFTTTSSSTITTNPSECDNSGDCGDGQTGCLGCAVQGPCAASYDACVSTTECIDYANCAGPCGNDQGCQQKCLNDFPMGAQLYNDLVICAFCNACPNDCGSAGMGCPE